MRLPLDVKYILNELNKNGFEAYVVGGCVRDSLLGKEPKDWDICTNALPEQTQKIFSAYNVILTGLQHGTITVMLNNVGYEITTYRIDGDYSDGRHPDSVKFTKNLELDLSRRDFTINAMAFSESEGIVDLYNGISDLKKGIIRCVGTPTERFSEDALRIMRAMRFASVLNFKIEDKTSKAMKELYQNLDKVSKERINVELSKLLLGKGSKKILEKYDYIIGYIIPEVQSMIGFEQNNPNHCYDVWKHTVEVVNNIKENDLPLKLAGLFHDIGKPLVYTETNGVGHFYGHAKKSGELTEEILKNLKYSNEIIDEVLLLVKYHDVDIALTNSFIRRMLNKLGENDFRKLFSLRRADILGQSMYKRREKLLELDRLEEMFNNFKIEEECFSLKQLELNGKDLISMGIKPGPQMGNILNVLLEKVINEELENNKEVLKIYVKKEMM